MIVKEHTKMQKRPKSINSLMSYLRDEKKINISGSNEDHQF